MIYYRLVDIKSGVERSTHAAPLNMAMHVLAAAADKLSCYAEILSVRR